MQPWTRVLMTLTGRRLGQLYYRVREGIGFNKTPAEYGAFPTDPYSHTPKHAGAKQPGMTGQVKEEVLCRFGELGVELATARCDFSQICCGRANSWRHPRDTGYRRCRRQLADH